MACINVVADFINVIVFIISYVKQCVVRAFVEVFVEISEHGYSEDNINEDVTIKFID